MIAHRLINARAAGCSIEVEDGDLVVEADRDPPAELIASLRRYKAELIAALLPDGRERIADAVEKRAATAEQKPLTLRDGRLMRSFPASSIPPQAPVEAVNLLDCARSLGAVAVGDGATLIVVEPAGRLPPRVLESLVREAGGVIAVLRVEHRRRTEPS
jgi:hypothetical protein